MLEVIGNMITSCFRLKKKKSWGTEESLKLHKVTESVVEARLKPRLARISPHSATVVSCLWRERLPFSPCLCELDSHLCFLFCFFNEIINSLQHWCYLSAAVAQLLPPQPHSWKRNNMTITATRNTSGQGPLPGPKSPCSPGTKAEMKCQQLRKLRQVVLHSGCPMGLKSELLYKEDLLTAESCFSKRWTTFINCKEKHAPHF